MVHLSIGQPHIKNDVVDLYVMLCDTLLCKMKRQDAENYYSMVSFVWKMHLEAWKLQEFDEDSDYIWGKKE